MNPNITKIIDQYLAGELNNQDAIAFEERLKSSPDLQQEVELQQDVIEGAKRAAQRKQIEDVGRNYHFKRIMRTIGMAVIGVVLVVGSWIAMNSIGNKNTELAKNERPSLSAEVKEQLNQDRDFDNLDIQYFSIPEAGSIVLSKHGVLLSVPKNAFLKDGKPYAGPVIIKYQEAIEGFDIVKSGLSTMEGDTLLETQGMISVAGFTPDGSMLEFNPKVGVYVQVPTDECEEAMRLYTGEKENDGIINWTNPEPLEKIPSPVDMSDLDFYPEGYEDKLDALKWKRGKKSRDSLYLSLEFSELPSGSNSQNHIEDFPDVDARYPGGYAQMRKYISENINYPQQAIERGIQGRVFISFDIEANGRLSDPEIIRGIDPLIDNEAIRVVSQMPKWIPAERNGSPVKTRIRIPVDFRLEGTSEETKNYLRPIRSEDVPGPYIESSADGASEAAAEAVSDTTECIEYNFVFPSNVMGFWNKAFNNTNLATREFEKRMRSIHATCNNDVLKKYTSQLDKSISTIDAEIVAMGYGEFQQYADECVGKVDIKNPHTRNLQEFYRNAVTALRADAKKHYKNEEDRRNAFDKHMRDARKKNDDENKKRKNEYREQESNFNFTNVIRQMRTVNGFTIRRPSPNTNAAILNVDKRRFNRAAVPAARMRVEKVIVEILKNEKYNDFELTIPNAENYIQVFAYVFPNKLNSYQRISHKDGVVQCKMNDDIIYDVAVVAITEKGYEYFQTMTTKGGNLGTITMNRVSERKMKASIEQLNNKRIHKPAFIGNELDWLIEERRSYKEQKRRQDMYTFRTSIKEVIYPCFNSAGNEAPIEVIEENNEVNSSQELAPDSTRTTSNDKATFGLKN